MAESLFASEKVSAKNNMEVSPSRVSSSTSEFGLGRSFYLKFLLLCFTLLIGILYCQFLHDGFIERCCAINLKDNIVLIFFAVKGFIQDNSGSIYRVLKGAIAGLLAVYYSWEIIYFDSIAPGIQPPSPLSPPRFRDVSERSYDLNHLLAAGNGLFFALLVLFWT